MQRMQRAKLQHRPIGCLTLRNRKSVAARERQCRGQAIHKAGSSVGGRGIEPATRGCNAGQQLGAHSCQRRARYTQRLGTGTCVCLRGPTQPFRTGASEPAQQALDVIQFNRRTRLLSQSTAQLLEDLTRTLHVDFLGDLDAGAEIGTL